MELGIIIALNEEIEKKISMTKDMGLYTCQLNCWNLEFMTDEYAERIMKSCSENDVRITALWCGWSGPRVWNFKQGPHTLGLVPLEYRYARMNDLKRGSDFAKKIGVTDVVTHVGFLPEAPATSEYESLVCALWDIAQYFKANGQNFLFETGQETPITLKRTIQDIGCDNLGINLDPANLIMYGKGNPVDALDVFGEYVKGVHGKDGVYPTDGHSLGAEKRIGDGKVNYPVFIEKLKAAGYNGAITIEREISGEQQQIDIKYAKEYLEKLLNN